MKGIELSKNLKEQQQQLKEIIERNRKAIPERYNPINLADSLLDDKIDWLISITNRTDGKSFNYFNLCLDMAIELDLKFICLARHFDLRKSYISLIEDIINTTDNKKIKLFSFVPKSEYTILYYDSKIIGIISDLYNASDLKLESAFLKDFPIIVYDEFLTLSNDYAPNEFQKLFTIYGSIFREDEIPYIKMPKIILLGNAVNDSSDIISGLDIYHILAQSKDGKVKKYKNIAIEMRMNKQANTKNRLRAFQSINDSMATANFNFNSYKIMTDKEQKEHEKNAQVKIIKTKDKFLKITYKIVEKDNEHSYSLTNENYVFCFKVLHHSDNYDYCLVKSDVTENAKYLDNNRNLDYRGLSNFSEFEERKFLYDDCYQYANSYTKSFILDKSELSTLNLSYILGLKH